MISVLVHVKTVAGLNAREHWRTRASRVRKELKSTILALILSRHPAPCLPVTVRLVRLSAGVLDTDNLQGAVKAIRDGVAIWLDVKDNDPRIVWEYGQEKCKRGDFGTRIIIRAYIPVFNEAEFKEMVRKGTPAWADVPDDWLEELRGNTGE